MKKIDNLKTLYTKEKISRRGFMEGALALGMTVATATAFTDKVAAATPNKGGTFRVGLGGASTTDSLDPATYISSFTQNGCFGGVHNCLTEVAANGDIIPELAERIEASDDAKVWTFHMRRGVEFHNGKTVTAEDAMLSIQHHMGEDSESAAKPLLADVEKISAPDQNTLVIELSNGNADFPFIANDYHIPILPSKDGEVDWQSGAGAGGYVLEDVDWGVRMDLVRNPNYWKGDDRAHFAEVQLLGIDDSTARQTALITGQIDAMNRVELKTSRLLRREPNVKLHDVAGNQHYTIPMLADIPPFDNNHVRMALKLAIDRQDLVDKILYGHGTPANDHPIGPGQKYFATELEQRAYDPDKARWHLQQAGMEDLNVTLHTADTAFVGAVDTAVLYQAAAEKAGITLNVEREPNDGYWTNVWMQKPWSMSYWGGRPTADWMFTIGYATGGSWNESRFANERFMELLTAARAELNDERRGGMYAEMQEIVRDNCGSVIPMYANNVDAVSKAVATPEQLASNWDLDGWLSLERWWFDEA